MNITFTSGDKRVIRSVMNYFFNAELTSDNIHKHIKYLDDKYKGVTITKKNSIKDMRTSMSRGTVTNICVKLKK